MQTHSHRAAQIFFAARRENLQDPVIPGDILQNYTFDLKLAFGPGCGHAGHGAANLIRHVRS